MKLPPGYDQILRDFEEKFKDIAEDLTEDDICQLLRIIYRLVQAARCWYKKIAKTLIDNLGYERGPIDPYLFYRKNEKEESVVALYVDDSALLGDKEAIKDTYAQLNKLYTINIEEMNEYIG